ncbi:hypothetical protein BV22DRAFT_299383 [Leucogyrophana mollusca]|uniref:Uncharacterized protein n=1 Tax=Leucogyrophana mollusca TaxID=85980 RepID=A0ACB8BRJ2_9AGAM|nr:hypothetical protein BV22DRAFT_299383 [Leucogyrophana mollusca]
MRWVDVLPAILTCASLSSAAQSPFHAAVTGSPPSEVSRGSNGSWHLNDTPAANATGHLVFETVSSLLQHWPNTRYRNGHTIVPGVIPSGTLLYHGTEQPVVPEVPEWVATDPEHSHVFCRGPAQSGCWQLTLAATRPLRVLYFDGTSASKMEDGPMDSQDVVSWGEPKPEWVFKEPERINDLCEWGRQHALDGYVRMEMDFEIMLCNLTSGVKVVSFLNLPVLPAFPNDPDQNFLAFETMNAGHWHNRYPGDERVQLDLTRLISFYDISLLPSLIPQRAGQERWDHRILGADPAELLAIRTHLESTLANKHQGSGVDWQTLFRVVIKRYADRLELVQYLLNSTEHVPATTQDEYERAAKVQLQLRIMLIPYILHSSVPSRFSASNLADLSWAEPVFTECATMHTAAIVSDFVIALTPSEKLLLRAIQETTREICRVVVRMWAEGVESGLDPYLPIEVEEPNVTAVMWKWQGDLNGLMGWLDWSVWIKCRPACGFEEICYLPTWPVGFRHRRRRPDFPLPNEPEDNDEWRRPQPKCIRRIEPYGF